MAKVRKLIRIVTFLTYILLEAQFQLFSVFLEPLVPDTACMGSPQTVSLLLLLLVHKLFINKLLGHCTVMYSPQYYILILSTEFN